jgi:hypothetical protein
MHACAIAMKSGDPTILAALDAQETPQVPFKPRSESCVFYPILFGLVFEALASHTSDSTSSSLDALAVSIALETLTSLVRPEYSGLALFEPATFNELIGLFYRMILTECAEHQILLIPVIVSLVDSREVSTIRGK